MNQLRRATPIRRAQTGASAVRAGSHTRRSTASRPVHHHRIVPDTTAAPDFEGTVFAAFSTPIRCALGDVGYETPTPIQEQSIPYLLDGRDLLGCAQTGTGKTAAFMLPILQYLEQNRKRPLPGRPRVLVLAPTRELAAQISDSVTDYGKYLPIAHTVIFGGVNQGPQVSRLRRGLDILVATPGRLLDLMQQGHLSLDAVEVFVLDEADRMLDMGFIPDVKRVIAKLPAKRQSLFYSATLESEVVSLARSMVTDPVHVTIAPERPTVEKIRQKMLFVEKRDKDRLLASLLDDRGMDRVIVFTRTKHGANKVVRKLEAGGFSAVAIHGNKSQAARTRALSDFRNGRVRVMVATDIAARGIDVERVSHVINYDLPNEPETYVHRIGRTARAGREGVAISFCSAEERDWLRAIERLIRQQVPQDRDHPFHSELARTASGASARPAAKSSYRRSGHGGNGRSGGGFHGRRRDHRPGQRRQKDGVRTTRTV